MRWVSREEMREIDRRAIEEVGIPAIVLMENAGRGTAAEAARLYRERALRGPVLVFCGAGNNGGDGFVVARHLANAAARGGRHAARGASFAPGGLDVRIFSCFDRAKVDRGREAGINLTICERMGLPIKDMHTPDLVAGVGEELAAGALVVDAIFGVGLSSTVREPQATLLRRLDEAQMPVLAVDVPSGLDANSGLPLGVALHADVTATMACPKLGLRGPGAAYVGRLVVVDLGIPRQLTGE